MARTRTLTLTTCLLLSLAFTVYAEPPAIGEVAPDFDLLDQNGNSQSLEDYRDSWVALYFYPKDDTPGCTTEACEFRDDIFEFRRMNCQILGVSLDDVASHKDFAEKYSLPFPLLADTDGAAADAYGVKVRRAGTVLAKRQTFLIDPEGRVARHYATVDPARHSDEILSDLAELSDQSD